MKSILSQLLLYPVPHRQDDTVTGRILHIDNFGNLITNLKESSLQLTGQSVTIVIGNHLIQGIARTYAEGTGPLALFGSSGYLEISVVNGNAAAFFQAKIGDEIKVKSGGN